MDKKPQWFEKRLQDAMSKAGKKKLKLSTCCRAMLLGLAKYTDKNGYCYPSEFQLEEDTGISAKNHHRYFKKLKTRNFLSVKCKYYKEKRMIRNYYTINLNAILELSIDQNGEVKPTISDLKTTCTPIEQSPKMTDCSKTVRPNETRATIDLNPGLSNTEQSVILGYKPDNTNKPDKEHLDNVQNKTLDVIKSNYGFDEFWEAYPRKEKKKAAYLLWMKNGLTAKAEKILMDIHDRRSRHDRWNDLAYIPLPTTYLYNEQWEDEIIDKHQLQENSNAQQIKHSTQSYIDQLNRVASEPTSPKNVSEIQPYLERQVGKRQR